MAEEDSSSSLNESLAGYSDFGGAFSEGVASDAMAAESESDYGIDDAYGGSGYGYGGSYDPYGPMDASPSFNTDPFSSTDIAFDTSDVSTTSLAEATSRVDAMTAKSVWNTFKTAIKTFTTVTGLTSNPVAGGLAALGYMGWKTMGAPGARDMLSSVASGKASEALSAGLSGPSAPSTSSGSSSGSSSPTEGNGSELSQTYASILGFDNKSFDSKIENPMEEYKDILNGEGSFYERMQAYFAKQKEEMA
jgi:hypothetical protein